MSSMHAVKVAKRNRPSSAIGRRHFFPVEFHDRHELVSFSMVNRTWLVAYNYNDPQAGRTVAARKAVSIRFGESIGGPGRGKSGLQRTRWWVTPTVRFSRQTAEQGSGKCNRKNTALRSP